MAIWANFAVATTTRMNSPYVNEMNQTGEKILSKQLNNVSDINHRQLTQKDNLDLH